MLEREHNERAWIVWHIAALGRAKKLPTLKSIQIKQKAKPKPRQTWQQQLEIARMWQRVAGGTITTAEERERKPNGK